MGVSADAARRFLVSRHLLAPARSLDGGLDAVLDVFRRLGSIQFDPLAVAIDVPRSPGTGCATAVRSSELPRPGFLSPPIDDFAAMARSARQHDRR